MWVDMLYIFLWFLFSNLRLRAPSDLIFFPLYILTLFQRKILAKGRNSAPLSLYFRGKLVSKFCKTAKIIPRISSCSVAVISGATGRGAQCPAGLGAAPGADSCESKHDSRCFNVHSVDY